MRWSTSVGLELASLLWSLLVSALLAGAEELQPTWPTNSTTTQHKNVTSESQGIVSDEILTSGRAMIRNQDVDEDVLATERLKPKNTQLKNIHHHYYQNYGQGYVQPSRPSFTNVNRPHQSQQSQYGSQANNKKWPELPDCSTQQVCNALFLRINLTHPLCRCPSSSSTTLQTCPDNRDPYDGHTMQLSTASLASRSPLTLLKTCEPLSEYRSCRQPRDWTLLALQNIRTGRSHYLILCRCPIWATLEGPIAHRNPPYADLPGIRVYGMLCWTGNRGSRFQYKDPPPVPWNDVLPAIKKMQLL